MNRLTALLIVATLAQGCAAPEIETDLGRYCRGDVCGDGLSCMALADTGGCKSPGHGDEFYRECDGYVCTAQCASLDAAGAPCGRDSDGVPHGYCDVVLADNGHGKVDWTPLCMASCDTEECPVGLQPHERDFGGCTCLPFVGRG